MLHVIYIPGLGDRKVAGQRKAVAMWKRWGVKPFLFHMKWYDDEPWESKLQRLLAHIDAQLAAGKQVAIVGASAGAAAAIVAYSLRQEVLQGCVLISGKVNHPESIGGAYRRQNPAFISCANQCPAALQSIKPAYRQRILSRYALVDGVVLRSDSRIPGAINRTVPTIGHSITIASQIIFGAPSFLRFLRRRPTI